MPPTTPPSMPRSLARRHARTVRRKASSPCSQARPRVPPETSGSLPETSPAHRLRRARIVAPCPPPPVRLRASHFRKPGPHPTPSPRWAGGVRQAKCPGPPATAGPGRAGGPGRGQRAEGSCWPVSPVPTAGHSAVLRTRDGGRHRTRTDRRHQSPRSGRRSRRLGPPCTLKSCGQQTAIKCFRGSTRPSRGRGRAGGAVLGSRGDHPTEKGSLLPGKHGVTRRPGGIAPGQDFRLLRLSFPLPL